MEVVGEQQLRCFKKNSLNKKCQRRLEEGIVTAERHYKVIAFLRRRRKTITTSNIWNILEIILNLIFLNGC